MKEYLRGGATQFLLFGAESGRVKFYSLRSAILAKANDLVFLEKESKIVKPRYSKKFSYYFWPGSSDRGEANEGNPPNCHSHLACSKYDTLQLNFAKGLNVLGLITKNEMEEIQKLINKLFPLPDKQKESSG